MTRWKIRKTGRVEGVEGTLWSVYEPDGTCSGNFADWPLAVVWATDITMRIEHWLQARRLDQ